MSHSSPSPERRVLLVEDDDVVRRSIARQLHGMGYVADTAGNAAKAIRMARAHAYDVILTDLVMPQLDGIELMAILARSSRTMSFILMTGQGDISSRDSSAVDGRLTAVLSKPLANNELQGALEQAFQIAERRRALSLAQDSVVRVLLLEDSPSDAFLLQDALERLSGYEVVHVTKLSEAVRLLHNESFDTVISDLTLPDARGLDAVLRIRECAPDATLLVCSSVEDEAMALRVIELGAQDFVVKGSAAAATLGRTIRFARVRRQGERRLALLAHTDPLTGLSNRVAFAERLDQALAQAKRLKTVLAVLYIDLDGFKAINDTCGHDAGDALLQQVATRIRRSVRDYDVVARLGGDEFAVLATNLAEGSVELTAERIASAIATPFELDALTATVTASIGVSSFPESAEEAVVLVKLADEAMYCAKRSGKSGVQRAEPARTLKPIRQS